MPRPQPWAKRLISLAWTTRRGEAVQSGEVPGIVVLVGRGNEILLHRSYGSRRLVPDMAPMTVDTIFDIASLTKPLGTTLAVMSLVEHGSLKLDAPVGRYLQEFRTKPFAQVTIQRLLTHTAGFPAIPPTGAVTASHPATMRALAKLPFDYSPGSGTQYSDVGFIILGEVVARVSGLPLDRYLERAVFKPLGLKDTTFNPGPALRARIAPTEWANGHMLLGEVHDPRARALGGVAGHAGMFSTAGDVGRICRMLVDGGTLDGRQVFKPATVKMMWTRTTDGSGSRALGWDVSSVFARSMMPFFPTESMIHTGFTGTSVMIDPASGAYLVLLTNRVHPNGGGAAKIRDLRVRVAAAVGADALHLRGTAARAGRVRLTGRRRAGGAARGDGRAVGRYAPRAGRRGARHGVGGGTERSGPHRARRPRPPELRAVRRVLGRAGDQSHRRRCARAAQHRPALQRARRPAGGDLHAGARARGHRRHRRPAQSRRRHRRADLEPVRHGQAAERRDAARHHAARLRRSGRRACGTTPT